MRWTQGEKWWTRLELNQGHKDNSIDVYKLSHVRFSSPMNYTTSSPTLSQPLLIAAFSLTRCADDTCVM